MTLLNLNISQRCNLQCRFCAADIPFLVHKNDDLSFARFNEILGRLEIGKGDKVVLTGGEPTFNESLNDFIKVLSRKGVFVTLFTNGTRMTSYGYLSSLVEAGLNEIAVPIYAIDKDSFKFLTNGNFEDVLNTLDNLSFLKTNGEKLKVTIKVLVLKSNIYKQIDIIDYLLSFKDSIDALHFNGLINSYTVVRNNEVMDLSSYCNIFLNKAILIALQNFKELLIDSIPLCMLSKEIRMLYTIKLRKIKSKALGDAYVYSCETDKISKDIFNSDNSCKMIECIYNKTCKINPLGQLREVIPIVK